MKALLVTEYAAPEHLRIHDVPEPDSIGKVLVDVRATGVSYPDLLIARGRYQFRPEPPFVLGAEVAGVVLTAPDGSGFAVGDRVTSTTTLGGYAERVAIEPSRVARLPDELTFEQGAAITMNYRTMEFVLGFRAALVPEETVVVLGAAGGIGTAAIQIAKAHGATVIAVVRREGTEEHLRAIGADHVVALRDGWHERIRGLAGVDRVDIVVDPIGGSAFDDAVRLLAPGGRLAVVGFAAGDIPSVKVNRLLLRNISVVGAAFGEWIRTHPGDLPRLQNALDDHVRTGLRPFVGHTYPLTDAAAALRALGEGRVVGKAVVVQP
ncbi:NADPH:quinone oxidoreductase family protein [Rhodococcus phenolicus]|uniref:NADPH:quinone oxidoreductase family protein n=1 Tax=Rhodococcus phenolicus TaxID=263849 RepID=UPI00082FD995|nr:NADPH:quinone oxidoreductase family protein [Rhodococcus phenolicus]